MSESSTQWIHNITLPLTDGSGGVSILGGAPGDTEFTIVISNVMRDSGGLYTCNANNARGSDVATYSVLILSELNNSQDSNVITNFYSELT